MPTGTPAGGTARPSARKLPIGKRSGGDPPSAPRRGARLGSGRVARRCPPKDVPWAVGGRPKTTETGTRTARERRLTGKSGTAFNARSGTGAARVAEGPEAQAAQRSAARRVSAARHPPSAGGRPTGPHAFLTRGFASKHGNLLGNGCGPVCALSDDGQAARPQSAPYPKIRSFIINRENGLGIWACAGLWSLTRGSGPILASFGEKTIKHRCCTNGCKRAKPVQERPTMAPN